jgi:hypothetical protein
MPDRLRQTRGAFARRGTDSLVSALVKNVAHKQLPDLWKKPDAPSSCLAPPGLPYASHQR